MKDLGENKIMLIHRRYFQELCREEFVLTCNSSHLEVLCNKKEENQNQTLIMQKETILQYEGEKKHKKGGLNCVFKNFFFLRYENCSQGQSLIEFKV